MCIVAYRHLLYRSLKNNKTNINKIKEMAYIYGNFNACVSTLWRQREIAALQTK